MSATKETRERTLSRPPHLRSSLRPQDVRNSRIRFFTPPCFSLRRLRTAEIRTRSDVRLSILRSRAGAEAVLRGRDLREAHGELMSRLGRDKADARRLRELERERPDLAEQVERGEVTASRSRFTEFLTTAALPVGRRA